ncbi:hypothetical protein OG871_02070 [Kitasatospora sp. NBC_00374]|uniref:hypothetical protein n=1 Tax=Kitasatospora sp. NBC_00374 TaxID=2975964 RepID=UPI003249F1D2
MTAILRTNRALRVGAAVLVLGGLALHLWLGTRIPLLAVPVGLVCHLAAGVAVRRRLRGRARSSDTGAA